LAQRARRITQDFAECSKQRFHKGFWGIINRVAPSPQTAEQRASSTAIASARRSQNAELPVEKKFGKRPRAGDSVGRIRCESRESPASDSPAAASR
jgi:hypothetical protein